MTSSLRLRNCPFAWTGSRMLRVHDSFTLDLHFASYSVLCRDGMLDHCSDPPSIHGPRSLLPRYDQTELSIERGGLPGLF